MDTISLCENCEYSNKCKVLKPCKDYAPALKSNFEISVDEQYIDRKDFEREDFNDENDYFNSFDDFN